MKRMTNKERRIKRIKNYFRETWKNKICALVLILIGTIATIIGDDATALVFLLMFAVPMFFINKNVIY